MEVEGCLLQATYRVRAGVPVVHLFGRLVDGRSVLVRDARVRPAFWIRAVDRSRALAAVGAAGLGIDPHPDARCSMQGEPLCRVQVGIPADVPPLRDCLHRAGVATYEADVRFATGYLLDRGIRGACRIRGQALPGAAAGVDLVFDGPELAPASAVIAPRVLSFDIETDPRAERLLAIALHGVGLDEVLVVDPAQRPMPERAIGLPSERAVLEAFAQRVKASDPDVLTGWNVVEFDLAVLARIAARLRLPLRLGRDEAPLRVKPAERPFGGATATITGRLVLDGIDLLRGAFVRQDDYSLDAVARAVLGEGKVLAGAVDDRVGEILANYRDDLAAFALYARTDARLALEIVERLDLINLAFARSRLTGMTPDRVSASIASFDFLYIEALHRRGIVAPTLRAEPGAGVPQAGGQVLEPAPGLYEGVWVFDFKSLYPSIIRTFNIDPLGFVEAASSAVDDDDLIVTPAGARFGRAPAILPQLLDDLMPRREAARRAGDRVGSQAIKILMNSFYGVLGTPACRFHNAAIANAITGLGRHLLMWTRRWFEDRGYRVLYGDTDSLFVASGALDLDAAAGTGRVLVGALNGDLARYVLEGWRVQSRLELQFEKLYARLLLPAMRHGPEGARKRYVGLRAGDPPEAVEFVGMEVVRRDWTELAKHVQRELYRRLFAGEPVDEYLRATVQALRAGELDDQLVYRKGLRKPLSSYTANTPPHVAAARKSRKPPGRVIAYVMTGHGPEPLEALTAPPDREHYLDRQLRPVAEPVLHTLGLDFDVVIGDATQLTLF